MQRLGLPWESQVPGGLWGIPLHVVHHLKEREIFIERGKEDKGGRKIGRIKRRKGIKKRKEEGKKSPAHSICQLHGVNILPVSRC